MLLGLGFLGMSVVTLIWFFIILGVIIEHWDERTAATIYFLTAFVTFVVGLSAYTIYMQCNSLWAC